MLEQEPNSIGVFLLNWSPHYFIETLDLKPRCIVRT